MFDFYTLVFQESEKAYRHGPAVGGGRLNAQISAKDVGPEHYRLLRAGEPLEPDYLVMKVQAQRHSVHRRSRDDAPLQDF